MIFIIRNIIILCLISLVMSDGFDRRGSKRPHVIMFIIDDLGYSDVNEKVTPTLYKMRQNGIALESMYTQPVCSPTRSAMMQGKFPYHTGMQHYSTIMPASYAAMPMDVPTLAETLRDGGYATKAVGKWHLGYASFNNTPTGRGFESHLGFLQGEIDYYDKTFTVPPRFLPVQVTGLDWWHNRTYVRSTVGRYNALLLNEEAQRLVREAAADTRRPLFMYYAHQIAHVPLQSPPDQKYFENCASDIGERRRTYCAMLAAVDESLALLVDALKAAAMWNDTLLIVSTDNGGMPMVPSTFVASAGVNYPLRAGKGTLFEGGVRAFSFVSGGDAVVPSSARGRTVAKQLMHAVDWFPTILGRAQVAAPHTGLDGEDLWPVLTGGASVRRTALPLNINHDIQFPDWGHQLGVLRADGWKLIDEHVTGPVLNYDGWFPYNGTAELPPENATPGKFLFNIFEDAAERHNLYEVRPDIVDELSALVDDYTKSYVPPQINTFNFCGLPWFHHNVWAPFADNCG